MIAFSLLTALTFSLCDRTVELQNINTFTSVNTKANETICFRSTSSNTIILFKHFRHYQIGSIDVSVKQPRSLFSTIQSWRQKHQKKTVGYYFGLALGQIEVSSPVDGQFEYIVSSFPHQCNLKTISTLNSDLYLLTKDCQKDGCTSTPSCFFHAHHNSTYSITVDGSQNSALVATISGTTFNEKIFKLVQAESELFLWNPVKGEDVAEVQIRVSIPNLLERGKRGYRFVINGTAPQLVEVEHHFGGHKDHEKGKNNYRNHNRDNSNKDQKRRRDDRHRGQQHSNKNRMNSDDDSTSPAPQIKYNYNNVYQRGGFRFPTLISVILTLVGLFFVGIVVVRSAYCCYTRNKAKREAHRNNHSDISALSSLSMQSELKTPLIQPQNIQIQPIAPHPVAQQYQYYQQQYPQQQMPQYQPQYPQQQMPQYPLPTVVYPPMRQINQ